MNNKREKRDAARFFWGISQEIYMIGKQDCRKIIRIRIVVDLEAAAYETYENAESVDGKYRAVFDDCESFTWLPTDEGGTR